MMREKRNKFLSSKCDLDSMALTHLITINVKIHSEAIMPRLLSDALFFSFEIDRASSNISGFYARPGMVEVDDMYPVREMRLKLRA